MSNTYKNSFWIFSETWSSWFCIVFNSFDGFPTNFPKNIGRFHQKENTNFPKRRWVRSKNVCLSSALLFSLVVTTKIVLRTPSDLFTWNNTCFLFKCRVTFRLRQFSKVRFGTLALYILRLRCLVISNTYKNSFCFLSKTETFQNDVECVPKMSYWALLGLILWLLLKKLFWELAEISLYETIRIFCSNAESSFGWAGYQRVRLVVWFFYVVCLTSDTMPNKKQSIVWKRGLCCFGSVQSFWWFPYKPFWKSEKVGRCHENQDTNFLKCRWVRQKISLWAVLGLFLLWEVREIDLREVLPVLVVILVVSSVFLFQQPQCPTELEKWPSSVCLKFFGQKDLIKDYFY